MGEKESIKFEFPEIPELREKIEKIKTRVEETDKKEKREEIIKEEIKKYFKELQKMPDFAAPVSSRDEVEEIKRMEPTQQVGALISLVFEKGLKTAIKVARALDNPAILDEFHDTLVDRYYEALIKKGILGEK